MHFGPDFSLLTYTLGCSHTCMYLRSHIPSEFPPIFYLTFDLSHTPLSVSIHIRMHLRSHISARTPWKLSGYLWISMASTPNIQSQYPIPISNPNLMRLFSLKRVKRDFQEWDQRMRFQTEETPFFMNRCLFSYVDIALHIDRCLFSYGDVSFHTSIFM